MEELILMDKHSVLRSIDLIEETTMCSELDVTMDLCESYNKMISILECYGDDVTTADDLMVFQEADNRSSDSSTLEKIKQFLKKIIESIREFFNKLMKKMQRETTPVIDKMKKQPKASKKKLNQVLIAAGCVAVAGAGAGVAYHVAHNKKDDTKLQDEYIKQINDTIVESQKRSKNPIQKLKSVFEEPDTDFIKKIKGYDKIIDNIKKSQTINMKFDFEKEEVSCSINICGLILILAFLEDEFFDTYDDHYESIKVEIQRRIKGTIASDPISPYKCHFAEFVHDIKILNDCIIDLNDAVSKGIDKKSYYIKEKQITEKEIMSVMKWTGRFIQAITPIINIEHETFKKVTGFACKITETPGWLDD